MAALVRRKTVSELVSEFEGITQDAPIPRVALDIKLGKVRPSFVSYTSWRSVVIGERASATTDSNGSQSDSRARSNQTIENCSNTTVSGPANSDNNGQLHLARSNLTQDTLGITDGESSCVKLCYVFKDLLDKSNKCLKQERTLKRKQTLRGLEVQQNYVQLKTMLLEKVSQINVHPKEESLRLLEDTSDEVEVLDGRKSVSSNSIGSCDENYSLDCHTTHTSENIFNLMNSCICHRSIIGLENAPCANVQHPTTTMEINYKGESDKNPPVTITVYEPLVNACMDKGNKKHATALHYKTLLTVLDDQKKPLQAEVSTIELSIGCVEKDEVQKFKDIKEYIVDELINSEEYYITQLQCALNVHQHWLRGQIGEENTNVIFGVLGDILTGTTQMLKEMKKVRLDYEAIGITFLQNVALFEKYPIYCKNRKRSEQCCQRFESIIAQGEMEIGDTLGVSLKLLLPIQRLAKYEQLLNKLKKHLERDNLPATHVSAAANLIQHISLKGNDLLELNLIHGKSFEFTTTGNFIMRDSFRMLTPVKCQVVLFLFNQKVIITKMDKNKSENYLYFTHINMEQISCNYEQENLTTFCLTRIAENGERLHVRLDAKSKDIKGKWLSVIETFMWRQLTEMKQRNATLYGNIT